MNQNLKLSEIKVEINSLTQQVADCIVEGQYENIDALLTQREKLIAELVAASNDENERAMTMTYLREIQRSDDACITMAVKERHEVQAQLSKLSKLEEYLSL